MSRCPNCQVIILEHGKYCHGCGNALTVKCPGCKTENSILNSNCSNCSEPIPVQAEEENTGLPFTLDFRETSTLADQIKSHFFETLRHTIKEEHDYRKIDDYLKIFSESAFPPVLEAKSKNLAEEAYTIHCKQSVEVAYLINTLLKENIDFLVDQFIIRHCQNLNEVKFSTHILKHAYANKKNVKISELIRDYLDPNAEEEMVYTDVKNMPPGKLRNAMQSFLFPSSAEKVFLICDQTVFGSCKEGFAITDNALYWKAHFHQAQSVGFEDIFFVKKEMDWVTINNLYFNVNPSMNVKILKLLKKLQKVYSPTPSFSFN